MLSGVMVTVLAAWVVPSVPLSTTLPDASSVPSVVPVGAVEGTVVPLVMESMVPSELRLTL